MEIKTNMGGAKKSTVAKVGVRIENYADIVHYHGNGIAAKVKI